MPEDDARARDLDRGREKLEAFRRRKALRASLHAPARGVDDDGKKRVDGEKVFERDDDGKIGFAAQLEAKLASMGAGNVATGSVDGGDDRAGAKAALEAISREDGDTALFSADATDAKARLSAAREDFASVEEAVDALGVDKIAGEVAGEYARELAALREAFEVERSELREEIARLEGELDTARAVEADIERLRQTLGERDAVLARSNADVDAMKVELAVKVEELTRATADIESARQGMEEMKTAVEEAKKTSKEKVKKAIEKGKRIESEKKALQEEIDILRVANAEHEKRSQSLAEACKRLNDEHENVSRSLAEAETKLEALHQELTEANAKVMTLNGMDDALAEEKVRNTELQAQLVVLHRLEEEKKEDAKALETANVTIESLKDNIKNAQIELKMASEAQEMAVKARTDADAQIEQLSAQLTKVMNSMKELEESATEERAKYENYSEERMILTSRIEDVTERLETAERTVFEKDAELESLAAQVEEARDASTDDLARLQSQLEAMQRDKEAQATQQAGEIDAVNSQLKETNEKLESLNAEKRTLETQLAAKGEEAKALTLRVNEISNSSSDEFQALREQLESANAEKVAQAQSIAQLNDAARMANEEIETLKAAKKEAEETLRMKDDEVNKVKSALEKAQRGSSSELEAVRARLDAAEIEKSAQHSQLVEINARLQEQSAEIAKLNSARTQAEETIFTRDEEITQLTHRLSSLENAHSEIEQLRGQVESLSSEKEQLGKRIAESSTAANGYQGEIAALEGAKSAMDARLKAKDEEITRLLDEVKGLHEKSQVELAKSRTEFESTGQERDTQMRLLQEQLTEADARVEALEKDLKDNASAKSAIEAEMAMTKDEFVELQKSVDAARAEAQDELSNLQAKFDAVDQEKAAQQNQLKEYVERLQGVESKMNELQSEKENLKATIATKNQEASQLRERFKQLSEGSNDEARRIAEELAELHETHKAVLAECEVLSHGREDVEKRLNLVMSERDDFAKNWQSEAALLSQATTRLADLEMEIANDKKAIAETSASVEEKDTQIAKLTEELEATKASGASEAQGRIGELNAALGQAQFDVTVLRGEIERAHTSLAEMDGLRQHVAELQANLSTSQKVQSDLTAKLSEANDALARQQSQQSSSPPPSSAARRMPRTPSDTSQQAIDIESGDRSESPSKTIRIWRDSRVTGRAPKQLQPIMEFCDSAFVRFFRVMRTQPSLRFAALSYWALVHAFLFLHFFA